MVIRNLLIGYVAATQANILPMLVGLNVDGVPPPK